VNGVRVRHEKMPAGAVVVAAGCWSGQLLTAELMAELIVGRTPAEIAPFGAERFS